jgi:hypothetical protein
LSVLNMQNLQLMENNSKFLIKIQTIMLSLWYFKYTKIQLLYCKYTANIVLKSVHSFGWLFCLWFYPIYIIYDLVFSLTIPCHNHFIFFFLYNQIECLCPPQKHNHI